MPRSRVPRSTYGSDRRSLMGIYIMDNPFDDEFPAEEDVEIVVETDNGDYDELYFLDCDDDTDADAEAYIARLEHDLSENWDA